MQYKFEIKPKLEKKLKKLEKKDPVMFKAARDKIDFLIWGITMKYTGRGTECFRRLHNLLCFISMK